MIKQSPAHPQRFPFDMLVIDHTSATAIFRQLESQLREAIWEGLLAPGEKLPATRRLAKELSVARNTVINAYEQLIVEGFIEAVPGSGTRVMRDLPSRRPPESSREGAYERETMPLTLSSRYQYASMVGDMVPLEEGPSARPFRAHLPAFKEFPHAQWAQLMARRLRQQPQQWLEKSSPLGYGPLREAISGYLGASRGLKAQTDQIIVTAGAQQGIELLAKAFINPGDTVCFEEPGYTPAAIAFKMAGADIVSIPVDEEGINVDVLNKSVPKAKFIYVTPSHHFPLGVTLSQSRRKALLQWAAKAGAVVLEDDYNGEYQYRGRPLPTLYAMAAPGQVIYIGSFSKLLFPSLRLGYLVVPKAQTRPLAAMRWLIDRHSPPLEQAVLADFIDQGYFARHLRRMRTLYAERQQALIDAAGTFLDGIMSVPPLDSGLHLIGWLEQGVQESHVLDAASRIGLEIAPVSVFSSDFLHSAPAKDSCKVLQKPGLILGYAAYSNEEIHYHIKLLGKACASNPLWPG